MIILPAILGNYNLRLLSELEVTIDNNAPDVDLVQYRSVCGHWCWQDVRWMERTSSCQSHASARAPLPVHWNSARGGLALHGPGRSWSCECRGTRTRKREVLYSSSAGMWVVASCRTWQTCLAHLEFLLLPLKQRTVHKAKAFQKYHSDTPMLNHWTKHLNSSFYGDPTFVSHLGLIFTEFPFSFLINYRVAL